MLKFYTLLTKALWKVRGWALKKISKKSIWAAFLVVQIVIKTKQLRYDFLAPVGFFFGKQLIFLKIKRAVIRILEPQTQICAIEEDIFMKI